MSLLEQCGQACARARHAHFDRRNRKCERRRRARHRQPADRHKRRMASRSRDESRARAFLSCAASSFRDGPRLGRRPPAERAPNASSSGAENWRRRAAEHRPASAPRRRRTPRATLARRRYGRPARARRGFSCATSSACDASPPVALAYRSTRGASSAMVPSRSTITEEPRALIWSHSRVRSPRRVG